jgi:hypothetical protein
MLCCTMTNLTLGFKIHARDGPDDAVNNDVDQINKTDQLTMAMCQSYNLGITVNMDN